MMKALRLICVSLVLVLCFSLAFAQPFPPISGKTLDDKAVQLPGDQKNHWTLILIGFSHDSQTPLSEWATRFEKDFAQDSRVKSFSVAVMEGLPFFLKGIVPNKIRGKVPQERHDRYLLIYDSRELLQKLVSYNSKSDGDSFLVLLDTKGEIRWQWHGLFSEKDFQSFKKTYLGLAGG